MKYSVVYHEGSAEAYIKAIFISEIDAKNYLAYLDWVGSSNSNLKITERDLHEVSTWLYNQEVENVN